MFDQVCRWDYVGVAFWIGRARCGTAILWIVAVPILRPESVHNEAEAVAALLAAAMGGTEFRRPGEIEQVKIECTRDRRCICSSTARLVTTGIGIFPQFRCGWA